MTDHLGVGPINPLVAALASVDLESPSTTKFKEFEFVLAMLAGLDASRVAAVALGRSQELEVQIRESARANRARLLAVILTEPQPGDDMRKALRERIRYGDLASALLVERDGEGVWHATWLGIQKVDDNDDLSRKIYELAGELKVSVEQIEVVKLSTPDIRPFDLPEIEKHPLVLDERIRRMLRVAIASSKAMMLVGPPGTGKTQLAGELIDEVMVDPHKFGMNLVHDRLVVTPDESWTTREIVGGETVDDSGHIRFSPGHVLEAIAADKWLVLDEANRADLDRIFAGLLTWLAGNTVVVGRASADPKSSPIILGWNNAPESITVGTDRLRQQGFRSTDPIYYLAGTEWRMIGTYNAVDAQRVFRFGLALGRRFAHVPVGVPGVEAFAEALMQRLSDHEDDLAEETRNLVSDVLTAIFRAHAESRQVVGPAALLSIPAYVAAGLRQDAEADVRQLIAEAYLTGMGTWLAGLDTLDTLGTTLLDAAVLGDEWHWVRNSLKALE